MSRRIEGLGATISKQPGPFDGNACRSRTSLRREIQGSNPKEMVYTDGKMLPPCRFVYSCRNMITVTAGISDPLIFKAKLQGAAVYLDNFAIKALAKGDPDRRRRFVDLVQNGAELLFSVANAAELSGPKNNSFDIIRGFLNDLGRTGFQSN